jgi:hypothetical protein
MIQIIEDFERKLPIKICHLKNEIGLITNSVRRANSKNWYVFDSIEAYIVTYTDGTEGLRFKDTSNPNYVDFTDFVLIPPVHSKKLIIMHGNYMVFEEDEFFINTKVIKLIFKAYERLRKSLLDRELFKSSHYISQVTEVFEMKIHNAMRYKLDEFAEMTEISKKAKMIKCEDFIVAYGEDEVMHIKLENNNVDFRIYLNPLSIKNNGYLVYDFNWTVPNTDINPVILGGFIKLYERTKVELLKDGLMDEITM